MFDTERSTGAPEENLPRETDTIGSMFADRLAREGDKPDIKFKKEWRTHPVIWNHY